jgi:membrane protease YdiL (CAAX protease family)
MLLPKKYRSNRSPQTGNLPESNPVAFSTTDRALWLEVLAVFSVGGFPHVLASITNWLYPPAPNTGPYWLNTLNYLLQNGALSFAVLYLIYRSGEGWAKFGIARLRFGDAILGLLLAFVPLFVFYGLSRLFPAMSGTRFNVHESLPLEAMDYVFMSISCVAVAFAEELVLRAYFVTRLEHLLRSQLVAIVVSAILFASCHIHLGVWAISPLIGGLLWGCAFIALRRIWPLILAHSLWDIFCFVAN